MSTKAGPISRNWYKADRNQVGLLHYEKKLVFYKHIFPLLKVLILSIIIIIFILRNFDKPKECDFFSRFKNLCFSYFVLVLTLHKIYSKLKVNTNFVNLIFIFSFNDKILSRI